MADSTKKKSKGAAVTAKTPAKKVAKPVVAAKPVSAKKPVSAAKSISAAKPAKPAVPKTPVVKVATRHAQAVSVEQRRNYVEVAAYYIAEGHGFSPGRALADWAEAEAKIEQLLREGLLNA